MSPRLLSDLPSEAPASPEPWSCISRLHHAMREAEAYVIVALGQGGFLGFLPFLEPGVVSSTPTVS